MFAGSQKLQFFKAVESCMGSSSVKGLIEYFFVLCIKQY